MSRPFQRETAPMPTMKLTYFDIPASRGEECRLALTLAGLPFEDERLNREQWNARIPSSPYGALPYLTVEGHPTIAQSNAILRLIGSQHGLHPTEPWEAARHEALMGAVEDFRARLSQVTRIKDPEEKKRGREDLATGYIQQWGTFVEPQIGDPFVGGAAVNVVDLKLFVTMTPLLKGVIDHIPPTVFKAFPKLLRLFEAVKTHPKVAAWYAK